MDTWSLISGFPQTFALQGLVNVADHAGVAVTGLGKEAPFRGNWVIWVMDSSRLDYTRTQGHKLPSRVWGLMCKIL